MLTQGDVLGRVLGRLGARGFSREYPESWVNNSAIRASNGPSPKREVLATHASGRSLPLGIQCFVIHLRPQKQFGFPVARQGT